MTAHDSAQGKTIVNIDAIPCGSSFPKDRAFNN